ncbi:ABC transporter substrate-binding protein [Gulosibacter chungangensis]|uniref:ABC transporter substrate-binding protein n=1 Tax=Gulosibacter chungangensis TaxID=979746 RepID=A0A7J5B9E6_9MICO|nr:ABC transporter substrate-binding protein [Gulosibacter chungangensis]KAB1642153.1 ABC transporter substrate-binding protein [Gulosibacter chungangensis]
MARTRKTGIAALFAVAALALSGCTGTFGEAAEPTGDDLYGGTLNVASMGDVDALDPLIAYTTEAWQVIRATTRQLITYSGSSEGIGNDTEIVPDLAESWDVSDDGLTYTFHLREGIHFSGATDREITANDFVYAIKRFPDPNANVSAITYYNNLFEGFEEYADKFAEVPVGDLGAVQEFHAENEISGVTALDDHTLELKLTKKSNDLLDILTLNFISPLPEEIVENYFADSLEFRQNYVSSGPYYISNYQPDQLLELTRVDGYDSAAVGDPRPAYADVISIDTTADSADAVAQKIQTGEADASLYVRAFPAQVIETYQNTQPENLHTSASGSAVFMSWNNSGDPQTEAQEALTDLTVRQSVNYAIDRGDLVRGLGGETAAIPSTEILTSTILGYNDENPYPTEGDRGDTEQAAALLQESGHEGLTLSIAYRSEAEYEKMATSIQASLEAAGYSVNLVPITGGFGGMSAFLSDPANGSQWDLAITTWSPDWQGNSASMTLGGWLNSDIAPGGTWNGVTYDNPELNEITQQAIGAEDPTDLWQQANALASEDLAWFPLVERVKTIPTTPQVANWTWSSLGNGPDFTSLSVQG